MHRESIRWSWLRGCAKEWSACRRAPYLEEEGHGGDVAGPVSMQAVVGDRLAAQQRVFGEADERVGVLRQAALHASLPSSMRLSAMRRAIGMVTKGHALAAASATGMQAR